MHITGLFDIKARIKKHFYLSTIRREDQDKKRRIAKEIYALKSGLIDKQVKEDDIIVSVTSYGERVTEMLPFMLYSICTQTFLPHKVVVWLDCEHWNDSLLPPLLIEMQRIGVDFYYCEDIYSYKKLIPALQSFPDNPIITFDDDFYYHYQYLEEITDAYRSSDKKTVIGSWWCIPEKKGGKYIPYNEWKDCKHALIDDPISFYCGYGTLFPPHIFDKEILKSSIFIRMCPTADDIWFWVMMERQHISRMSTRNHGYGLHTPIDRREVFDMNNANNLTRANVVHGDNNKQLIELLNYYNMI